MKKISIFAFLVAFAFVCNAQVNLTNPNQKTGTDHVDSLQLEKINEMPMDTLKKKRPPNPPDTTMHRRTGDDADPNRNNPKKKE